MRLLTFTSLYPNAVNPNHGVFVENRLVELLSSGRTSAVVVAPVPWFPFRHPRFGRFSAFARIPRAEERRGVRIVHPRYLTIPGLGALLAPLAIAMGSRGAVARLIADGDRFDAIDAHYFFPDGVAAALMASWFKLPLVITARGSDINEIAHHPLARRAILWAAGIADGIVTVSQALRDALIALGVDGDRTVVLRNGVDAARFRPLDRAEARSHYGIDGTTRVLLSVGRLHALKGHDLAIEAVAGIPDAVLLIAGSGSERQRLEANATALGVIERVRFLGQQKHDELAQLYSCADVLVLASAQEGWPNVLLESMACGTPVVTTRVGGTPEIVTAPEAGVMVDQRTAAGVRAAIVALLADPPDRAATRRYAERFSWDETSRGQERLFESVLRKRQQTTPAKRSRRPWLPWRFRKIVSDRFPLVYHLVANAGLSGNDAAHWDAQLAKTWDQRDWPTKVDRIRALTEPHTAILDIGCGSGSILRRLAAEGYADLHGLEISDYAVARLRQEGITMWQGRLPDLPMPEARFDCVIASQVLEHIIRRTRFAREMRRVLRPGGDAFIFVPDNCLGPIDEPEHVIRYDANSLRAFLSKTFQVVSVESMRDANYAVPILFAHVRKAQP